jgi:hypothetical protein
MPPAASPRNGFLLLLFLSTARLSSTSVVRTNDGWGDHKWVGPWGSISLDNGEGNEHLIGTELRLLELEWLFSQKPGSQRWRRGISLRIPNALSLGVLDLVGVLTPVLGQNVAGVLVEDCVQLEWMKPRRVFKFSFSVTRTHTTSENISRCNQRSLQCSVHTELRPSWVKHTEHPVLYCGRRRGSSCCL